MDNQDEIFISDELFDIPAVTEWNRKCSFLCFHLDYLPAIKKYFLNGWAIDFGFPVAVLLITISSYLIFIQIDCYYLELNIYYQIVMTILVLLFLSCYVLGVLVGPGYIPYYYPRRYNKFQGKEPDYLSEFVTNIEQKNYIKNHKYPAFCHYVSEARRIAIRPDHLCIWFSVFIGKLNYKFFLLFNMYGFLYITAFSVFQVLAMMRLVDSMVNPIYVIITIIYLLFGFVFSILTCIFFFDSLHNTSRGTTNFEMLNKITNTNYHDGCCENFEEVCGPRENWFLWMLPIPAFWGMDVYSLTAESDPYKML